MAALKETYDRFVATPSVDDLHEDATLTFVSSGISVTGANEIVKYILSARHEVQVIENILSWHAGYSSLTVEVAADCKFKEGPGWIVPGVEGNLLDGMTVKLPVVRDSLSRLDAFRSKRPYFNRERFARYESFGTRRLY
jgi:hypothetical protein